MVEHCERTYRDESKRRCSELTVSIIVPVVPGGDVSTVLNSISQLNYPAEKYEILIAEGFQPSRQRNRAAQQATGDILYFLDNDSQVTPNLVTTVMECYSDESIAAVGGPNLTSPTDSVLQKAFGNALGSKFAHSSMAARYRPLGRIRVASEKELILCNLSVRRTVFIATGGFDESLYPNEENEFLNRLQLLGYKLIYHPQAIVYRSRRNNIPDFFRQLLNYGRGRMEQAMVELNWNKKLPPIANHPQSTGSPHALLRNCFFLAPFLFSVYVVTLPITVWFSGLVFIPFVLYGILSIISAVGFAFREKRAQVLWLLPPIYLMMHIAYSCGLVWALVRRWYHTHNPNALNLKPSEVTVNIVKSFANGSTIAKIG